MIELEMQQFVSQVTTLQDDPIGPPKYGCQR